MSRNSSHSGHEYHENPESQYPINPRATTSQSSFAYSDYEYYENPEPQYPVSPGATMQQTSFPYSDYEYYEDPEPHDNPGATTSQTSFPYSDYEYYESPDSHYARPAISFDEILVRVDAPPDKVKRRSTLLERAATATRQVVVGPSFDERASGKGVAKAHLEREEKEHKAEAKQAAKEERLRELRDRAALQGKYPREDDLYKLAKYEGVYLNPRPSWRAQLKGKKLKELASPVVARLCGPMLDDGRFKDHYLFLGRDKCLYAGLDRYGADARMLSVEDEEQCRHIRQFSRAYYGLCT